jgi:ribosome-associated protein
MIVVTPSIAIAESELVESFVRASGPGGQNVNKVSTAVELRFDAAASPSLTNAVRARLAKLAGRRMTASGVLIITAQRHRTQERNRAEARAALIDLLRQAAVAPAKRFKTRPTLAATRRRLEEKARRSAIKRGRAATE